MYIEAKVFLDFQLTFSKNNSIYRTHLCYIRFCSEFSNNVIKVTRKMKADEKYNTFCLRSILHDKV